MSFTSTAARLVLRTMVAHPTVTKRTGSSNWKQLQARLPSKRKSKAYADAASASSVAGPSTTILKPAEHPKLLEVLLKGSEGLSEAKRSEPGKFLAIDCEMVGVGLEGRESVLARVSVVNYFGTVVLDTFVRPQEKVLDLRTWVSGVKQSDLEDAPDFRAVAENVSKLVDGKVLIGHAIQNEFKALRFNHPRQLVRDTQLYKPLQTLAGTKHPALRKLAKQLLDVDIQSKAHSSVDDARATMAIYRTQKADWERSLRSTPKQPVAREPESPLDTILPSSPVAGPSRDTLEPNVDDDDDPLTISVAPSSKDGIAINVAKAEMPRRGEKMTSLGLAATLKTLATKDDDAAREAKKKRKRKADEQAVKRPTGEKRPRARPEGAKEWWEV